MLVLDKVLTALRVNAYSARAERVALNSKYQQQKGSTEPEFAEKKLHRELARVSLASCLVVVAGDYEPKPSDRLKGQGRVSIADIVASFIAKGDPKLSTKLPEWGTSKEVVGLGEDVEHPILLARFRLMSSLLMSASATPTGKLVRRKKIHNVLTLSRPAAVFNSVMVSFPVVGTAPRAPPMLPGVRHRDGNSGIF